MNGHRYTVETQAKFKGKFLLAGIIGLMIGFLVVLEPIYIHKIATRTPAFSLEGLPPFSGVLVIIGFLFLARLLIATFKNADRAQSDQIFYIGFFCTLFVSTFSRMGLRPTFIVVSTALAIFFIRGAMDGWINIIGTPTYLFMSIFFLTILFSAFSPVAPSMNVMIMTFIFMVGFMVPFFFLVTLIRSRKQYYTCLQYIIFGTLLSAVIGIIQTIIFRTTGKLMIYKQPGLEFATEVVQSPIGEMPRVSALFTGAHTFGATLGFVSIILLFYLLTPELYERRHRKYYAGAFLLTFTTLILTFTNMNLLTFMAATFLVFIIKKPRFRRVVVPLLIVGGILAIYFNLPGFIVTKLMEIKPGSIYFRIEAIQEGLDLTKKYPVTGTGLGMFGRESYLLANPHNLSLWLSSQTGFFGVSAFWLFYCFILFRLLYYAIRSENVRDKTILYSFFVILLMIFSNSLTDPLLTTKVTWFFLGMAEAAICQLALRKGEKKSLSPEFGYVT